MKKRLLCSLLVCTMVFSQAVTAGATTVSDNTVESSAEEAAEPAGTESAEVEAQQAVETDAPLDAETIGQMVVLDVPTRIESGVSCVMEMTITPNTEYTVQIVDKKTGRVSKSNNNISKDSKESILKINIDIGKEELAIGDYEVRYWAGSYAKYEEAVAANVAASADLAVRNSIRKAVNSNMSDIKVVNAVYTGKSVVPQIILKDTTNDADYQLVNGKDFEITVISDNKKELGKAKAEIKGIGNYAGTIEVDFDIVPQAPAITGVTCVSTSSVKITWNQSANAQGYAIDRKAADGSFVNVGQTDGKTTSFTDTTPGLLVGQTYYYRVQARAASTTDKDKEVTSVPNEIGVAVKIQPAAPEIVSLDNVSTTRLKLSWKKSEEADGYRIYKIADGKKTRVRDINNADTTSYTIKKLSCGYTYQYCVETYKKDAAGNRVYSNESKRVKAKVAPAMPQLVSVTSVKATVNELKWKKVSGATGYCIYRKESGSSKWKRVGTIRKGTTVTFQDTKAKTGKKYAYTVKAYTKTKVNGKTKTIYSKYDTKGITGKAVPAKTVFAMQQNAKGVLITIANSEGASGYYLYRKKGDEKWMRRDVPAQNGDFTIYLDRDITAASSYQYYIVPYTQTETSKIRGAKSETQKLTTK